MRNLSLLLPALSLAGCVLKGPHVPSDLKGDVPVVIANRGPSPICAVLIQPFDGAGARTDDNWLGDGFRQQKIGPGKDREFRIKAGTYRVGVAACDSTWGAGTKEGKMEIQQATYVAIGTRIPAPADYQLAFLPTFVPQQISDGGGGGGEEEAPAAEEPAAAAESSSSESAAAPAPTVPNPGGKPSGAVCTQSYECASNACITHSPDDYCR